MLSQPQETLILYLKQSKTIAATCLAFPHGDVNNFVVGSEDGTVYGGKYLYFSIDFVSNNEFSIKLKLFLFFFFFFYAYRLPTWYKSWCS